MTWFRVDDTLATHPKAIGVSLAAMGLWVMAGSWSSQQLTNGFVPVAMVPRLGGTTELADELVASGLWERRDTSRDMSRDNTGYVFHEWSQAQPTRDAVEARRTAETERKAAYRERMKSQRDMSHVSQERPGGTTAYPAASRGRESDALPTRPDPTRPDPTTEVPKSVPRSRGSRLPDDFAVTADMTTWAQQNAPTVNPTLATEKFIDYWRSVAGANGVKLDWLGTWRNWIRREAERYGGPASTSRKPSTTDQRVQDGLRLVAELRAEEAHQPAIGAS